VAEPSLLIILRVHKLIKYISKTHFFTKSKPSEVADTSRGKPYCRDMFNDNGNYENLYSPQMVEMTNNKQ